MSLTPPDMSRVRRLLIVKLSSIGDVVHALPVSAALGESFPHIEISWIVEEMSAPMLTGNPYLKEIIRIPVAVRQNRLSFGSIGGFAALRRELHSRHFDVALDLQGLSKSALVAWASGAKYRYGYDWLREVAPLFEARVPRRTESVHIVDQFLDVARFLGADVEPVRFPLHIPEDEDGRAVGLLETAGIREGTPFIAINPSTGGGGNKGWGADRFAQLIDAMADEPGLPLVLVGSTADEDVALAILSSARRQPVSLVGKTNLKQLSAVLKRCVLHVCGDTGSAHIAAAVGTPVVSIFGRSNPARLAPYGQGDLAVHHREQCAVPCKRFHETAPVNSKQKCLAPPPVCLTRVTVEEVLTACEQGLARSRAEV